jgi:RNA polymerase sigma factor (sigma-70 family)
MLGFQDLRRFQSVQQSSEDVLPAFGQALKARESTVDRGFEELFIQHYPRLVKTLVRLTGDPGLAEELAAETFCKLYQRRGGGAGENPAGWIYKAGMNLGLDALRSNSRRLRREELAGKEAIRSGGGGGPLHELLAEEKRERVRLVIARMKPVQGQVLLMGSSGFSCKEMAEVLGLKADSLYTLIARAKAEFEKKYVGLFGGRE